MDAAEPADDQPGMRPKVSGGVQSLYRATAILEVVGHSKEGIGLADLCKAVELPSSTAFHLAKTLVQLNLLRQDEESKRYRIGRRLFSLAAGALDEQELLNAASPILNALARDTGETSHLGVRMGHEAVIIGRCDGPSPIRVAERIGAPRPLHATSMGKVLLAELSDDEISEYLNVPLRRITSRTVTDPEALLAIVSEVRRSNVAFDDGEFIGDGRCIAAPVRDYRNRVACAIGISAPVWRLGIDRLATVQEKVQNAAQELSRALGYEGDPAPAVNGNSSTGSDAVQR